MQRRSWLFPAILTACLCALGIVLGAWQIHRLAWKEAILAQIDAGERGMPVPLGSDPAPFARVLATGKFRPGTEAIYGAEVRASRAGPVMGGQLLTVLDRPGALAVLVDRGWVATKPARPAETPAGPVSLTGYVRFRDKPGWFSAHDDIAGRQFFTLDPEAIASGLGAGPVAPFTLVALADGADGYPEAARTLPRPPNNHLSYAITWFALSATLGVIFLLWLRRTVQRR